MMETTLFTAGEGYAGSSDKRDHAWADPLPLPAEVVKGIRNGNSGFYDPELNAYFCHFASDSSDNGTTWVYRYKKAK